MANDYIYDVFVSYRRKPPVLTWLQNHFYPMLEQWLPNYLPVDKEVNIFIDWQIETGDSWPNKLKKALSHSRCLLPIWSPEYFRSKWCLAEWQTIKEREKILKIQSFDDPSGLTFPVVFADGIHFPKEAQQVQYKKDLKKWNCPFESFRDTKGIVELDKQVQFIAEELSKMIIRAPKLDLSWPIITPAELDSKKINLPRF